MAALPLSLAALEQIEHNVALIEPGMDFREYMERSWPIPDRYLAGRYSCLLHGVGLADEYPYYAGGNETGHDHYTDDRSRRRQRSVTRGRSIP